MFQRRLNVYDCDACFKLIPKSCPVIFHDGRVFCSHDCKNDYLDAKDEHRLWQEEIERNLIAGEHYD